MLEQKISCLDLRREISHLPTQGVQPLGSGIGYLSFLKFVFDSCIHYITYQNVCLIHVVVFNIVVAVLYSFCFKFMRSKQFLICSFDLCLFCSLLFLMKYFFCLQLVALYITMLFIYLWCNKRRCYVLHHHHKHSSTEVYRHISVKKRS